MLKPIKTFYIKGIPQYSDIVEAHDIAKQESCVVEIRWLPNTFSGWYHEYIFEDSSPAEISANIPKIYGL